MTPTNRLTTSLEIKQLSKMQFEGHGSIFGNVDLGGDVVMPGAFKRTLAEHKAGGSLPVMLWQHDHSRVLGKWLDMNEDDRGLVAKGELAPTDLGKEIHELLKMEAVKGLSIGYIPTDIDYDGDGTRLLKEVDLLELSVVSIPMNPKAQIQHVKSRLSARGEYVPTDGELAELKREAEKFLRNRGFSRKTALQCATNLFSTVFDPSATLADDNQQGSEPDDSCATPDDIVIKAGLDSFQAEQQAYEIRQLQRRFFQND